MRVTNAIVYYGSAESIQRATDRADISCQL